MQILQNALIPALLAGISLYALCKGVDVFPTFLRGAAVGLKPRCRYCLLWSGC